MTLKTMGTNLIIKDLTLGKEDVTFLFLSSRPIDEDVFVNGLVAGRFATGLNNYLQSLGFHKSTYDKALKALTGESALFICCATLELSNKDVSLEYNNHQEDISLALMGERAKHKFVAFNDSGDVVDLIDYINQSTQDQFIRSITSSSIGSYCPIAKDLLDNIAKQSGSINFSPVNKGDAELLMRLFEYRGIPSLSCIELGMLERFYANNYPEIDFLAYAESSYCHSEYKGDTRSVIQDAISLCRDFLKPHASEHHQSIESPHSDADSEPTLSP